MAQDTNSIAKNVTYFLTVLCGALMILGSLYLRLNYGEGAAPEVETIKYNYPNVSGDPIRRNRFRNIRISFNTLKQVVPGETKDVRMVISRSMEVDSGPVHDGVVFSLVIENMARFKSILFDYDRCVIERETTTDIVVYLLIDGLQGVTMRKLIIYIDRRTDTVSLAGYEIDAKDILDKDLEIALNQLRG